MINSAILPDGIHLTQNGIYRGRLSVPFYVTQSMVASGLKDQGFTDVQFFEKATLPADWPDDQRVDESAGGSHTDYLQGRFTLTDRVIPMTELPSVLTLNAMWLYLAPAAAQPVPPGPPPPSPAPPLPEPAPVPVYGAPFPRVAGLAVASAAGVALGFAAARMIGGKKVAP